MLNKIIELLLKQSPEAAEAFARIILPAAGDYAAGDVLSGAVTGGKATRLDGLARTPGAPFYISKAIVTTSVAAFATGIRLWVFSGEPVASTINDNVALTIAASDRPLLQGVITLSAAINAGGISFLENDADRKLVIPSPDDTGIWVIVQAIAAETGETANMALDITLTAERV